AHARREPAPRERAPARTRGGARRRAAGRGAWCGAGEGRAVSPHEALLSASGLRPMSAFVVVGSVVVAVAVWVRRLACLDSSQPERVRSELGEPPAYSIAARGGETLARFVPRFDLELSPRSLWQAHTPRRLAEALARVLGGKPSADELLAALLP